MRELNSEAFWKLIGRLDPDPERAGEKYEALRHKLVVFFEGRSCGYDSDGLADRTLDRVAGKLVEAVEIYAPGNLPGYAYGVARFVWKEWLKERKPEHLDSDPPAPATRDPVGVLRLACLDRCLGELPPESRKLIVEYYQGETSEKIENRSRMAQYLGISPNALRRRAHWIRVKQLEPCLEKCDAEGGR